jgi:hypothetical protein
VSDVPGPEVATGRGAWTAMGGPTVKGAMLWFDEARDYGFVLTDDGERLRVERDGFVDGAAPVGRCARRPVSLSVGQREGERIAVDVSFVPEQAPRRARRRSSSIRSAWS